jgi:hypothetical protein
MIDEERIEISENQLKEAKQMVEESDIKYDEVRIKDYIWNRLCLLSIIVKQKFPFCMMCLD